MKSINLRQHAVFSRLIYLTIGLLAYASHAQQMQFDKQDSGEDLSIAYEWRDHAGQARQLNFSLPKSGIRQQFKRSTQYRPNVAQRNVYVELQREAMKVDPREARIKFIQRGSDLSIEVESQSPEVMQKWSTLFQEKQRQAFLDYLKKNYYVPYRDHLGQEAVKPDHIRYAMESRKLLLPAAQAIYEMMPEDSDARQYINLVLSWVQSIPYNTLENRLVSNGSGYFSPVEVITNNLGDCDSKSTLTIALLRALLPEVPMIIIYLPDHALLGISSPHRDTEPTVLINGVEYLLFEPTGPALIPLGEAAQSSVSRVNSGMYTYEQVPAL